MNGQAVTKSLAQVVALFGDSITVVSFVWVVTATLFMKDAEQPIPGSIWPILLTAAVIACFLLILQKGATVASLAALSLSLLAVQITVYIVLYRGYITFGYVLSVILMAAVSVFVSLYFCLTEQTLLRHLIVINLMILSLIWLFLFLSASHLDSLSVFLIVLIALTDVGGAVGLRMSDGGMSEGVGKAFALAVCSAGIAAGLIFLLARILSGSGNVTGAVLNGIRSFFLGIWHLIEAFIEWLSQFIDPPEAAADPMPEGQTVIGTENAALDEISVDPVIVAIVIGVIIASVVLFIVIRFRRYRVAPVRKQILSSGMVKSRRKKGAFGRKWQVFLAYLRFRRNAFRMRNTSPGVLAWLERKAARKKTPRRTGESIRTFLERLSPDGTFSLLAEDLERGVYGRKNYALLPAQCRELRRSYRKEVRAGSREGHRRP